MTHTEKNHLVDAYMAAWLAVNDEHCVVNIDPNGWFSVKFERTPHIYRRRAVDLLRGLAGLTAQLAEKAQKGEQ